LAGELLPVDLPRQSPNRQPAAGDLQTDSIPHKNPHIFDIAFRKSSDAYSAFSLSDVFFMASVPHVPFLVLSETYLPIP
jgi:hypothetical protein